MGDDFDVDALLEAPFKEKSTKEEHNNDAEKSTKKRERRSRSRSPRDKDRRHHERRREPDRVSSRDKEKHESSRRDHERRPHRPRLSSPPRREREHRDRDKERDKERERVREREREKYQERERERELERERRTERVNPYEPRARRSNSPVLTPEERDARTVFVWQLSARIRQRDLEEFFSSVGKIRDVRLIMDNKTRRSKGISYVEFREVASVQLALGLTGTKLLGVPIQVQPSQAEKNRIGQVPSVLSAMPQNKGPMKLYVGSLHYNITEDMLMGIFEPFGKIDEIKLVKDPSTQRSQGYGFVTYHSAEEAKKAMEQLNGFELAGRGMKVGNVVERTDNTGATFLDTEELDKTGVDLGTTGRLALMAKLAEGTGMKIPESAQTALNIHQQNLMTGVPSTPTTASASSSLATQCFMLSNMFDPRENPAFHEIRDDVLEECNKLGGVLHLFMDKASPQGNIYVKCVSIAAASQCVGALHGRYFSGRMITAAYVPLPNYHQLFPDSAYARTMVMAGGPV